MNNKIRLSVVIVLALGTGVATWRYFFSPTQSSADTPTVPVADDSGPSPAKQSREDLSSLLSDPRVQRYFQREKDKRSLQDYFSNSGELSAEESWRLIEAIEAEGRIMAYEAMALKLAWLERNSASKVEFDRAAGELVEGYRQKSQQSVEEYDPYEDVPGFAEYKEMEAQIVREVQQMTTFPDGMSKQEYLRRRLQEARENAYQ
ncbi:hypothetical protein [Microbulbifer rhizosphaerae]|uniref:Uncharacterized protein n=1 Tax=Microbulbifer rhizosphaerae TaxID=1562603 RepID=A0A7W4WF40_9GAMM|nr:hypothetical protein [Microbulbifer rhizosphaerae]MBB3063062.1 hypothetical protein [Microbulbifer rhizosphaerae]